MKEHLQPPDVPGGHDPLAYIIAKFSTDSLALAGGVDDYVGSTSVKDTLTHRMFSFILKNPQDPAHSYFRISINNYQNVLGDPEQDLAHSIFVDNRHYQELLHFILLGATVEWYDSAGVKFSSEPLTQGHLFSITAVEDLTFEGRNYKKAIVQFVCNLSDGNGHTLHLTEGRGSLLFGIN